MSQKNVDLYYTVCPVPAASSIAIDRGEFARAFANFEGGKVKLHNIRQSADRKVREAHYDQTQPGLFREGGNIPPLWARSDGRDLRLIGLTWIEHYSSLLSLPNSGIRTPADLKGKRIALTRRVHDTIDYTRATQLRGIVAALKAAGLKESDVKLIDITIDEPLVATAPAAGVVSPSAFSVQRLLRWEGYLVRALQEGTVDAILVTGGGAGAGIEPLIHANVVYDVSKALNKADRINNLAPVAFTVRGEFLASNPDVVSAYLAQSIRTARWAKTHAAEAARHIARNTGIAEESVAIHYSPGVTDALEPTLNSELIGLLDNQKDFLLEHGFLKRDFSIADFVAEEPLAAALDLLDEEPVELAA